MRKYLLSIAITALGISHIQAQVLDKVKMECQYKYSWVKDTTKRNTRREDFMILKVGEKVADFYSYNTFRVDSAIQAAKSKGNSAQDIIDARGSFGKKGVEYHIFKNYPSGKITVTDKVATDNFKYQEETMGQKWQIQPGKTTVCGYAAQKATCAFAGRQYTAWFTTEVPVATGPWKFSGLPGLIVKVEDQTGDFRFELVGLHQVKDGEPIQIKDKPYIVTTKDKFQKLTAKFYADPINYINNNTGMKITPVGAIEQKSIAFNPIER